MLSSKASYAYLLERKKKQVIDFRFCSADVRNVQIRIYLSQTDNVPGN